MWSAIGILIGLIALLFLKDIAIVSFEVWRKEGLTGNAP